MPFVCCVCRYCSGEDKVRVWTSCIDPKLSSWLGADRPCCDRSMCTGLGLHATLAR